MSRNKPLAILDE